MYTKEQREKALQIYDECHSVTKVIRCLGYPKSRQEMYVWLRQRDKTPPERPLRRRINNSPQHPLHPSVDVKLAILNRCFIEGENVKLVSEETGYSRASIYAWRRKYQARGLTALMNPRDKARGELKEGKPSSMKEIELLKQRIQDMQLEIDILNETLNVLKKDPSANIEPLKNREKAAIVDALKKRYPLPLLLSKMRMAKSSYYYQKFVFRHFDKYAEERRRIVEIFHENKNRYGYRRIHGILKRSNISISEKIVRRIMREEHLEVLGANKRKTYNSYRGEISPSVPNLLQRDFHADKINEKWLTDITEFAIPAGKVYLSVIVDCFDGMIIAWTIGTTPDSVLVNTMLDKAVSTLSSGEYPIIHSDRGCHYRWPGWIMRMEKAQLKRSMSKKGCSPDNSACEGLFGRLKNEMFYYRDWRNVSICEFMKTLNDYIIWYNQKRIKISLGNMSPLEYRQSLGLKVSLVQEKVRTPVSNATQNLMYFLYF